ncbi:uncharacterized protein BO72DRAFT_29866 [Aspergillus fijiensis CBS 313.89]|uniref:Secreted protein n=1 Tax=Aspergillus fijiensis CBS 313.89 TaxID=1448319 RepID=A0A8G1RIL9_9EURO|nr:uncharacterized protein BO72DRAFT_29866 [Aspergillus fijiensis CBS 313.89]RAK71106.1 hypothetical protein BO72DRAFT_29866 [Aspergillus fijiensis CBS 313.89]
MNTRSSSRSIFSVLSVLAMPCPRLVGVSCSCSCMAASHLSLGLSVSSSFAAASASCLPAVRSTRVIIIHSCGS